MHEQPVRKPRKLLSVELPWLATRWHPTRNEGSRFEDLAAATTGRFWWLCTQGHEFHAPVRYLRGGGECLVCSNRQLLTGFNDLATTHPELAAEWHPSLNTSDPTQVGAGSSARVWWLCPQGHAHDSAPVNRSGTRARGCRYCANKELLPGYNDLVTLYPEVAAEWHPTKNGTLKPTQVMPSSSNKVWWHGTACGHDFLAALEKRTHKAQGCSVCAGKQVQLGFTDLASQHPTLAAEWHPTKNKDLTPEHVTVGSSKLVHWVGPCGHEFTASVKRRVAGAGCSYCSKTNKKVLAGSNDLAYRFPLVAAEWHPTKNGDLQPDQVVAQSGRSVWWQCPRLHEWTAPIGNRTSLQSGCPDCNASSFVSQPEKDIAAYLKSIYDGEILTSHRRLPGVSEVDIYLPDAHLAIEYNGLYWHTELSGKDRNYHRNKWLACKEQGIQLIQVWEDEWIRNPEQVKRMLAHKLGIRLEGKQKVMARKTIPVSLSKDEAQAFLTVHHVQQFAGSTYHLGLRTADDELVAVLSLRTEPKMAGKVLNIVRYATSASVPGGFTKLLKHAERTLQPDAFITFSDHCISDGSLYRNNSFVADKELPPDYMYVVRAERKHKFGYRLVKFRNDPGLKWEEGLTERELATLNGLARIWDAGKTRWVKRIS